MTGEKLEFHVFGFEPNVELIDKAVSTPDDIGKILRVRLAVEQQLNALLSHVVQKEVSRLSFNAKLVALRTLLINDVVCEVIEKLNDLRNQLAHNPKATLANNKSIAEEVISLAEGMLPTLGKTAVRFAKDDDELHEFASMEIGEKLAVVGAMVASYLGNMPKYRKFSAPSFKNVPGK